MASEHKKTTMEEPKSKQKGLLNVEKVVDTNSESSIMTAGITVQGRKKLTSTPAINSGIFPTFDVSAISADASYVPALKQPMVPVGSKKKLPLKKVNSGKTHNMSVMGRSTFPIKPKAKPKDPDQLTEEELDLLYCQYIQALYLESRAKKSLDLQSKDAVDKLQRLWAVNQILMEEEQNLQRQLDSVRYVKQLLECCSEQKKILEPLSNIIPKVMGYYEEIANSVECIRHKLHTSMVLVPSGPEWENELSEVAGQCESLMQTMLSIIPPEQQLKELEVTSLLQNLVHMMGKMSKEFKRCATLLVAADQFATTEVSLKIGQNGAQEDAS